MHRLKILAVLISLAVSQGCNKPKPSGLKFPEGQYIKASAQAAAVMDFQTVLSSNMGTDLSQAQMRSGLSQMGLKAEDIERVVVAFPIDPAKLSGPTPPFLAVVKLSSRANIKTLLRDLRREPSKRAHGKTYYYSANDPLAAYFDQGDKLLLVGREAQIKEALGDSPQSQLVRKLEANMDQTMYACADVASVREQLVQALGSLGPLAMPLQEPLKSLSNASLSVSMQGDKLAELRLETTDAKGAEGLNTALTGLLAAGKTFVLGNSANSIGPAGQKDATAMAREVVQGIKIEQADSVVTVSIAMPRDFINRMKKINAGLPNALPPR